MWTRFMDMCSGGGTKEKWDYIYIEANKETAKIIFYNRFGHNPDRISCTCCGEDYSISSEDSLEQITSYDRDVSLSEYKKREDVLIISKNDIKPEEMVGEVPVQGYVWQD